MLVPSRATRVDSVVIIFVLMNAFHVDVEGVLKVSIMIVTDIVLVMSRIYIEDEE